MSVARLRLITRRCGYITDFSSWICALDDGKKKVWKPPPKVDQQRFPSHFRSPPKPRIQATISAKWKPGTSDSALESPAHFVTPSGIKKETVQLPSNRDNIISPPSAGSPRVLPGRPPKGSKPLPVKPHWPPIGRMHLHPGEKSKERTRGLV
jgi:hypothetical protein